MDKFISSPTGCDTKAGAMESERLFLQQSFCLFSYLVAAKMHSFFLTVVESLLLGNSSRTSAPALKTYSSGITSLLTDEHNQRRTISSTKERYTYKIRDLLPNLAN